MGWTMSNAENGQEPPGKEMPEMTGPSAEAKAASGTAEADDQKKAYAELNDRFLRLAADFDNFKRRSERDRASMVALANERFACDILEVVDNIERALKGETGTRIIP